MASNQLPKGGVEAANRVRPSQSRITKNRQASFTDSLLELDSQISQKQTYSHSDLPQQQLKKRCHNLWRPCKKKGVLFCGERLFLDFLSKNVVIGIDPW